MAKNVPVERKSIKDLYMQAGIDPATIAGYGAQAASLHGQYKDSIHLLNRNLAEQRRATRRGIRDVRAQGRENLSTAVGTALDRGVLGSSGDVTTRERVRADTKSGVAQARESLAQAASDIAAQRIQARRDYFSGLANLQAQRQAAQAMAGVQAYNEGLLDHLVNTGGGGGGGSRGPLMKKLQQLGGSDIEVLHGPNVAGHAGHLHLAAQEGLKRVLKALEKRGFRIGEHPGYGNVTGVHTGDSWHYSGDAADINYDPVAGGRWNSEAEALMWLKRKLKRALGNEAYYG